MIVKHKKKGNRRKSAKGEIKLSKKSQNAIKKASNVMVEGLGGMGNHMNEDKKPKLDSDIEFLDSDIDDDMLAMNTEVDAVKAPQVKAKEKKRKSKKGTGLKSCYVTPTTQELDRWREVQFLHHSNFFQLQMQEMFEHIDITTKTKLRLNDWVNSFTNFVASIKESEMFNLEKLTDFKQAGFDLPWPMRVTPKSFFKFYAPSQVKVIGSYALDLVTKHESTVDLALVLPEKFFQDKDFSNAAWLLKRVLFLSFLGKKISENFDQVKSVKWFKHLGSSLRPTLKLELAGPLGKWSVHIYPVPPTAKFKLSDIDPRSANIGPKCFYTKQQVEEMEKTNSDLFRRKLPSPYHNWLCSVDAVAVAHCEYLAEKVKFTNMRQGIKLLKLWAAQRGINKGVSCLSGHALCMLVCQLAHNKRISAQQSPYQVFRGALLYLYQNCVRSSSSLFSANCFEESFAGLAQGAPTLEQLQSFFAVVLYGPMGKCNLTGGMAEYAFEQIRAEAKESLKELSAAASASTSASSSCFDDLFLRKRKMVEQCDQMVHIRLSQTNINTLLEKMEPSSHVHTKLTRLGDVQAPLITGILEMLHTALGDRIRGKIRVRREEETVWSYGEEMTLTSDDLILGFKVNPTTATAILTKGPLAEDDSATKFREFWGDLSELRKFKDNTFHETVVWSKIDLDINDLEEKDYYPDLENKKRKMDQGQNLDESKVDLNSSKIHQFSGYYKRSLPAAICKFVISQKLEIQQKKITIFSGQLESALAMPYVFEGQNKSLYGTGEDYVQSALVAYNSLVSKLNTIELPLAVHDIQSVSEAFRGTNPFPPLPTSVRNVKNQFVIPGKSFQESVNESENKKTTSRKYLAERLPPKDKSVPLCLSVPYRPTISVNVELLDSSRWPKNCESVKAVRAEFLLKIAAKLRKGGHVALVTGKPLRMLVLWEGYVFSVKIVYKQEVILHRIANKRQKKKAKVGFEPPLEYGYQPKLGLGCDVEREGGNPGAVAEKMHLEINVLPRLAQAMQNLESLYPLLSTSLRLIRRWMGSQLLMPHFSPWLVDLLACHALNIRKEIKINESCLSESFSTNIIVKQGKYVDLGRETNVKNEEKEKNDKKGPKYEFDKDGNLKNKAKNRGNSYAQVVGGGVAKPTESDVISGPTCPSLSLIQFWKMAAATDWSSTPLLVPLDSEFNPRCQEQLTQSFIQNRSSFPPVFLITPYDPAVCTLTAAVRYAENEGEAELPEDLPLAQGWGAVGPAAPLINRLQMLAQAALATLEENMWNKAFDFKSLFRPSWDFVDFKLILDPRKLTRFLESVPIRPEGGLGLLETRNFPKSKKRTYEEKVKYFEVEKYQAMDNQLVPIVDFDPAQICLEQLQKCFGHVCLFLHDPHGGDVIGAVWRPNVFRERKFHPSFMNGEQLDLSKDSKETQVALNVESLLEEMKIIGRGLVLRVEVNKK